MRLTRPSKTMGIVATFMVGILVILAIMWVIAITT